MRVPYIVRALAVLVWLPAALASDLIHLAIRLLGFQSEPVATWLSGFLGHYVVLFAAATSFEVGSAAAAAAASSLVDFMLTSSRPI
eukprot:8217738-Alexandrium_andersonii.AAC.1